MSIRTLLLLTCAVASAFGATFQIQFFDLSETLCTGDALAPAIQVDQNTCVAPPDSNNTDPNCRVRMGECDTYATFWVYPDASCSSSSPHLGSVQVNSFCTEVCGTRMRVPSCEDPPPPPPPPSSATSTTSSTTGAMFPTTPPPISTTGVGSSSTTGVLTTTSDLLPDNCTDCPRDAATRTSVGWILLSVSILVAFA